MSVHGGVPGKMHIEGKMLEMYFSCNKMLFVAG